MRFFPYVLLVSLSFFPLKAAQVLTCQAGAVPFIVRAEGLTEQVGDITLICSGGAPSATITGNLTLFLNVSITNRLAARNATDIQFTYDISDGTGPHLISAPGILSGGIVSFSGVSFPLNSSGSVGLHIFNIRGNATKIPAGQNSIQANLAINGLQLLPLSQTNFVVGYPKTALLAGFSGVLICEQAGSVAPAKASFAAYLAAHTAFSSTRLTEGFASAFEPLTNSIHFNGTNGERFLITYSGLPDGAQIMVPDVIAGSTAIVATAGGDLGVPAAGGTYAPTVNGSLLLARVNNTDASGAGGTPVYRPGPVGTASISFDALNPVQIAHGTGIVVYEVMDAAANTVETAQFPSFLVLAPHTVSGTVFTNETVSLAPVSTIGVADGNAPVSRFVLMTPPADCTALSDCNAHYFPQARVSPASVTFSGVAGGGGKAQYVQLSNAAGGVLGWQAQISYSSGSDWIQMAPMSGVGGTSLYVYVDPSHLTAGTYQGTINFSAGPSGIPAVLAITFNVAPPPPPPPPAISGITSAADFGLKTLAPGSLATIFGSNFGASGATVTFSGAPAAILFQNTSQLNLLVPASLVGQTSTQVVVSANAQSSTPATVSLGAFEPGIFPSGVLNQDNSLNSKTSPAPPGTVIQIFATGLSGQGTMQAKIGSAAVDRLLYGGPAPGLTGVQQINFQIPPSLVAGPVAIEVCGTSAGAPERCSALYTIYVK